MHVGNRAPIGTWHFVRRIASTASGTTPGDTSMATLKEVKKLAGGGSARVDR